MKKHLSRKSKALAHGTGHFKFVQTQRLPGSVYQHVRGDGEEDDTALLR